MKRKLLVLLAVTAFCLLAVLPAMAADVFAFTEKVINLFEGETAATALTREGKFADGGEIEYTIDNQKAATTAPDGTVTAVAKGKAKLTATLKQDGRKIASCATEIRVARRVTKVTLSQKDLTVYMPDDPVLQGVLAPADESLPPDRPVIVLALGKWQSLNAVCTPEDASNRKISYATSDVGIAKINGENQLRPVEKGECELTVSSVQNPEISETFHVLVIDPVKKIKLEAPAKVIFIGETMSLDPVFTPETASIQKVVWTSRKPQVATVNENGVVTAVSKGQAVIEARAADGSGVVGTLTVNVAQQVTDVTLKETEGTLPVKKQLRVTATVLPKEADNRKLTWESSDESIATVRNGDISAKKAGTCEIYAISESNPDVRATFYLTVVQPVTKITFTAPAGLSLPGRISQQLEWSVEPADATITDVTFKSNQPQIATVDANGVVTAVGKGRATIEARAADGAGAVGRVTVNVAQEVTDMTLKETEGTVAVKRQLRVTATVLPKDADNKKLIWESSDENIATVRNGDITGKKAGTCEIYAISESNPSVRATFYLTVVQPVTRVSFTTPPGLTFPIRTSQQLTWSVEPDDATIKDVTFKSNQPKIATVDENGLVNGISKGAATITVTAADGSKKSASYRVNITQPVEGVQLTRSVYYVQRDPYRGTNIRATILPKEANNQNVYWEVGDEYIASVRPNGTSTGRVTGLQNGTTTVTAITEDGGFVATAGIQVADYDGAVFVESLQITADNKILISLLNLSAFTIDTVYLRVDCYDTQNQPMIYNRDGVSTGFDASYPLPLMPGERSIHGQFNFGNFMDTGTLGAVIVTVTGYQFDNGQTWEIPEEYRIPSQPYYSQHMWEPTPTPLPPTDPII